MRHANAILGYGKMIVRNLSSKDYAAIWGLTTKRYRSNYFGRIYAYWQFFFAVAYDALPRRIYMRKTFALHVCFEITIEIVETRPKLTCTN